MLTRVLAVDPLAPDATAVAQAARVLANGGVVAFPTETFYGLGVAAMDAAAVRRLFALKGRPESRPILVLVDDPARVDALAEVPDAARTLMARHWPGALTLVLRARPGVPAELTAGTGTIGVRQPAHAVARALVTALDMPVTAPSANLTGEAPPTTAKEVLRVFEDKVDLVLDVTVEPPRVLREGAVRV